MGRGRVAFAALAALPALAVVQGAPPAHAATYGAEIRRTTGGVPHILASDFGSLGFGFGYAFAQDDICPMAEDYVTVDAQRSRYFGPDGSYMQEALGLRTNNLDSDLYFQQVNDSGVVDRLVNQAGPFALPPEVHDLVAGYAVGYDRYLADVGGTDGVTDPTCRGKPWVRPIGTEEAYRRFYQLIGLASADVVIDGIAQAQPPAGAAPGAAAMSPSAAARLLAERLALTHGSLGSNAVAVGSAGTRDHTHGLLLGNPHFPWVGTERFYQAQLTIPGRFDVEGATLFGVPLVLIGHTDSLAWSHTVSTAFRFTPYQLTLLPGSPTTYLVDGRPTAMTSRTVTVQALQPDGSVKPVSRTLWSTRYGPVFNSIEGIPLPWTPSTAFALADANADNMRVILHFFYTDQAHSVSDELSILERYQGIPWVNTIASDRDGHALYADIGTIPHVTDHQAQQCDTALGAATFAAARLPVLDGSRSACAWGSDADAVKPGIFGIHNLPRLLRADYVENSNDSYWLSNPHQPLVGFARIIGDERTARTLRTRIGLVMTDGRVYGTDGLGTAGFTRQQMQDMVFGDRQYGAELARDATVGMCRSFPGGVAPTDAGPPVPVGDACNVLAAWSMREDLDAPGALLWSRYWSRVSALTVSPWLHPFDASDPVHTPNTLNTDDPQVRTAFGDAVADLQGAGLPAGTTLRTVQGVHRGGTFIPVHGGVADPNGEFNAIYTAWTGKGLADVSLGSSYVQVVTWNDATACPDAATILTYSLSVDPTSPHSADQTEMFSRKQWVTEDFCEAAIAADPALTVQTVGGGTRAVPAAAAVAGSAVSGPAAVAGLPDTAGPPAGAAGMAAVFSAAAAALLARRRRVPRREVR